jgi:hypothetical protein
MKAFAINIKRFVQSELRNARQTRSYSSTSLLASIFVLFWNIFSKAGNI